MQAVRDAVSAVDADTLVGGVDAQDLDAKDAAIRDQLLVIPLILGVVLVMLLLLLRSVVASIVLVLTVVATYVSSLGASWYAFTHWFGFPALDLSVPLLSFLFLVALGVDYNIFLTTRAREEAFRHTTTEAISTSARRHGRGHHQRRHPARRRVHGARRASADHLDPDRDHRRLRRAAGHAAGAQPAGAGTGGPAGPALLVARRALASRWPAVDRPGPQPGQSMRYGLGPGIQVTSCSAA